MNFKLVFYFSLWVIVGGQRDVCSFEDSLFQFEEESTTKQIVSAERLLQCVDQLTITNVNALWTLYNLLYGVVETYSFADLAVDTLASKESNSCNFKIHEVKVNLGLEIRTKLAEITRELDDISGSDAQGAFLSETRSAYEFHSSIAKLFSYLHDAHTLYMAPLDMFVIHSVVGFGSRMEGQRQVITLKYNQNSDVANWYREAFGSNPFPAVRNGTIVTHIDGMDALEYLQREVSDDGFFNIFYQGRNQRLNGFFFSAERFRFSILTGFPKNNGITLTFTDGESVFVRWVGSYTSPVATSTLQNLNNYINSNPTFTSFMEYEAKNEVDAKTMSSVRKAMINQGGSGVDGSSVPVAEGRKAVDLSNEKLINFATGREEKVDNSLDSFTTLESVSYRFYEDAVVVFIPNFSSTTFFSEIVTIQQKAKQRGIKRILFDFSGNGGGSVAAGYAFLWFFVPKTDVCPKMLKRVTWNWQVWLQSFDVGLEKLLHDLFIKEGEDLLASGEIIAKLPELVKMFHETLGVISDEQAENFNAAYVEFLTSVIRGGLSDEDIFNGFNQLFQDLNRLVTGGTFHGYPNGSWFPFDAFQQPVWGAGFFEPITKPYTNLMSRQWGPAYSKYSLQGEYFFCQSFAEYVDELFGTTYDKNYWTNVGFVTDGTCGSTCATVTSTLQLSGSATAFSYGGTANEVMDIASFSGGNVEDYDRWWPRVTAAAKLGDLASYGTSHWSVLNRDKMVSVPMPFPTRATARFNWNVFMARELGNDALPRQYYVIPAHRHLNLWADASTGRDELYSQIMQLDWCDVKSNPQFQDEWGVCPAELVCKNRTFLL